MQAGHRVHPARTVHVSVADRGGLGVGQVLRARLSVASAAAASANSPIPAAGASSRQTMADKRRGSL
ncbi:Uncharacterised protein [Mycobacteroides abscessus subsp. abscessus]|nr:Uncharacterised protein [Mycobacteroides abscessus subsp. abscessus]